MSTTHTTRTSSHYYCYGCTNTTTTTAATATTTTTADTADTATTHMVTTVCTVWRWSPGNCLATVIIGDKYDSFDAAKAACKSDDNFMGVREPEHQTRTCSGEHEALGYCNKLGSICATGLGQDGTTHFKPTENTQLKVREEEIR